MGDALQVFSPDCNRNHSDVMLRLCRERDLITEARESMLIRYEQMEFRKYA